MDTLQIGLVLTTVLCSLVAGLILAFTCVVMPGIGSLNDREFIQAFQAMDRVIQNKQPLFMLVWVGSIAALGVTGLLGVWQLGGVERLLLVAAVVVYLVGVQLPTGTINVPLNNQLQTLDVRTLDAAALAAARAGFEPRWNRWNTLRTVFATLTAALLMLLMLRL